MGRYEEADLTRLKRIQMCDRHSKVNQAMLAQRPVDDASFETFWDGLPGVLAADDLRSLAKAIVRAKRLERPIVWMMGAHVIKVGLGPLLIKLLESGFASLFAVNGAFTIHDAELAWWGGTSEEVGDELHEGRFGMGRETAALLNSAALEGSERDEGLGEAIGRVLASQSDSWSVPSVAGSCYQRKIPLTVHVAIGTDIIHQHPDFSGKATGCCSARDFRIFSGHLKDLQDAVIVNVGSAVIMPEVFLKAFSVATNLGAKSDGLVTATLDFNRHYRPFTNVTKRPSQKCGKGYYIVGHHEVMLPLLLQGVLVENARYDGGN